MKKVVILGGGASALLCACFACKNAQVTILEQNEKVGKKILATGNGRCNLTNLNMGSFAFNQNVDNYLNQFSITQTIDFFKSLGLETYADDEGRVYPLSNSATSVLDVLKNFLQKQKNVILKTQVEVLDIKKEGTGYRIVTSKETEFCDNVVVALGNKANLNMFEKFNIKTKQFRPSLCALKCKTDKILAGVRVSGVQVSCNTKAFEFCEMGEVLFRQDGISGIVIFNLSAYFARHGVTSQKVIIDFLPQFDFEVLKNKLLERKKLLNNYCAEEFLTGFLNRALNHVIIKNAKIKPDALVKDLTVEQIIAICSQIKNHIFEITGYLDNNQVFTGGVKLSELTLMLESKQNKGLYFAGEVIDVDGVCGGFNLQWAWTSANIVGNAIINK